MNNPNDTAREQILNYFHGRNAAATSERGKKGCQVKISVVKAELKALHGLTQQQVMSNLTYLIDKGWIARIENKRTFATNRGTEIPSEEIWYKITSAGIDKIEGESSFKDNGSFSGININAEGSNVISVGNGTVVNTRFRSNSTELEAFRKAIVDNTELTDARKIEMVGDVVTLQGQLAKSEPDASVIGKVWRGLQSAAAGTQLAQVAVNLAPAVLAGLSR